MSGWPVHARIEWPIVMIVFGSDSFAHRVASTANALRTTIRKENAADAGGTTVVSCRDANPGRPSWPVKQAPVDPAAACGRCVATPGVAGRPPPHPCSSDPPP